MGVEIDNKVVSMSFDNKDFEARAKESMSTLEKLKEKLKFTGATKGLNEVNDAAKKVNLNPLSKSLDEVKVKFSALQVAGVTALANITTTAMQTGKRVTEALTIEPVKMGLQEYETQINAIQTILANTEHQGTTLGQVNAALDELNKYADQTIYNFTEMTRNIGTFTAAGVDLETSVSAIKGIANLAAISGSSATQASTAMYQLSQALAAGRVSLEDWNSVMTAGMGGKVFQDALKNTAKAMGIVVDETKSFRESIMASRGQQSWLTSDVLLNTLKQFTGDLSDAELAAMGFTEAQIANIQKMADTALAAATEVKTATGLMDTLKESVQSGWTATWEILIGDFEEAKTFFTELSNTIGGFFNEVSDSRNALLGSAFSSNWKQISNQITDTGLDLEVVKAKALELGITYGKVTDEMLINAGTFDKSLKAGWLTADILVETLKTLEPTANTDTAALAELASAIEDTSSEVHNMANNLDAISGREYLLGSITNSIQTILQLFRIIGSAWDEAFPPNPEGLKSIAKLLYDLSNKGLVFVTENSEKLGNVLKGLFSILDMAVSILKFGILTPLKLVGSILGVTSDNVLDIASAVGEAVYNFKQWVDTISPLEKAANALHKGLMYLVSGFDSLLNALTSSESVQNGFSNFMDAFGSVSDKLVTKFKNGGPVITEFVERLRSMDGISLSNISKAIEDFSRNVLSYFFDIETESVDLKSAFVALRTNVIETLKNMESGTKDIILNIIDFMTSIKEKLNGAGVGSVISILFGASVIVTIKKFADALQGLTSPIESIKGAFDSLSGALEAYASSKKAEALKTTAEAIAILTASVIALALVPWQKVAIAVVELTALGAGLFILSKAMSSFGDIKNITKSSTLILSIGLGIMLLAQSVNTLGTINASQALTNFSVVAGLAVGLTAMIAALSKVAPSLNVGATSMVALSGSLYILTLALIKMGEADVDKVKESLIVLVSIFSLLKVITSLGSKMGTGAASSFLILASSLLVISAAIKSLGKISSSDMQQGLVAVGAIFGIYSMVMLFSQFSGANSAKAGAGILAMTASLLLLSTTMDSISSMKAFDIAKVSAMFAAVFTMFGFLTAVSHFAGSEAVKAGVMLTLISGSMVILTGVIWALSFLDASKLAKATAAVSAISVVFGGLIAVSKLLNTEAGGFKNLVVLTTSVGLLAIALGALSFIESDRLLTASASLSAALLSFAVIVKMADSAKGSLATLGVLTAAVGLLGGILYLLAGLPVESTLAVSASISTLLLSMSASMAILSAIGPVATDSYATIGIMTLVVGALGGILYLLGDMPIESTLATAASLSVMILSLSGACAILTVAGAAAVPALAGIGVLAALIASVGLLMYSIGALHSHYSQLDEFLDKGMASLEKIGYGLGSFFGGAIAGIAGAIVNSLPQMGESLSEFGENLVPFLSTIKMVDGSVLSGVANLSAMILLLTASDLVNGIMGFFTGESSLSSFADELVPFGEAMVAFSNAITENGGIDPAAIEASATAGKALAELASKLPNSGGLLASLVGDNSLTEFAEGLEPFALAMVAYSTAITSGDGIDEWAIRSSANAGKALTELADSIPNKGGTISEWVGDNTLTQFAQELQPFALAMVAYSTAITTGGGIDEKAIEASTNAGMSLSKLAESLPNSGGTIAEWMGDNTLSEFAKELIPFATSMKQYSSIITADGGIDTTAITASANAGLALSELADTLPEKGGLLSWFTGENVSFEEFGKNLTAFGQGLVDYSNSISQIESLDGLNASIEIAKSFTEIANNLPESKVFDTDLSLSDLGDDLRYLGQSLMVFKDVDPDSVHSAIGYLNEITDLFNGLAEYDTSGVETFVSSMSTLAETSIDEFTSMFEASYPNVQGVVNEMMAIVDRGIDTSSTSIIFTVAGLMSDILAEFGNHNEAFEDIGVGIADSFLTGLESQNDVIETSVENMSTASRMALSTTKIYWTEAGEYVVDGFIVGLQNKEDEVKTAAMAIGTTAEEAVKQVLDIHSPSGVFEALGGFTVQGFIDSIKNGLVSVEDGATAMGSTIISGSEQSLDISGNTSNEGVKVGQTFTKSVAKGIEDDKTAEEKAKEKAQKIVDTFQKEFDKIDLGAKTSELEYNLWEASNASASDYEKDSVKLGYLRQQYATQEERIRIAEKEYKEMVKSFGEYSDQAKESYNKLLQQQIDLAELQQRMTDLKEEGVEREKALLDEREEIIDLEYQLWEKQNEKTATEGQKAIAEYQMLSSKYLLQTEKLKDAKMEYDQMVAEFGQNAENTHDAYKTLLEQQIELTDLANQLSETRTLALEENEKAYSAYKRFLRTKTTSLKRKGYSEEEIEKMALEESGYQKDFASTDMSAGVKDAVTSSMTAVKDVYVNTANTTFSSLTPNFVSFGETYITSMGTGMTNKQDELVKQAETISNKCVEAITKTKDSWSSAAVQVVNGFISGISSRISAAANAAAAMARAAYEAAMAELDINSPSRKFREIGRFADLGFAEGLKAFSFEAEDAAIDLAKSSLDSMNETIANLYNSASSYMNDQPVIRPVLDISDITSKTGKIDAALNRKHAMSIDSDIRRTKTRGFEMPIQNGESGGVVNQFVQNNYSPKSLSRIEIYRQTKNLLSMKKGGVR